MLGRTEAVNATNNPLLNTASSVGLDSSSVLSLASSVALDSSSVLSLASSVALDSSSVLSLIDSDYVTARAPVGAGGSVNVNLSGSGTVDKILTGASILAGQTLILRPDDKVEKIGQPITNHNRLVYHVGFGGGYPPSNAGGNGNISYSAASYADIIYLENNKFVIFWTDTLDQAGYQSFRCAMGILNTEGTSVTAWGPILNIVRGFYNSGTSYGYIYGSHWTACKGDNNRIHVGYAWQYHSSYVRRIGYLRTIVPGDISNTSDLSLALGAQVSLYTNTSTSNNYVVRAPSIMWDEENRSNGGIVFWYHWEGSYSWKVNYINTSGNTIELGGAITSPGEMAGYINHNQRSYWDNKHKKWIIPSKSTYAGGRFVLNQLTRRINQATSATTTVNIDWASNTAGGDDEIYSGTDNTYYGCCYDSGAERGIVAYNVTNRVGWVRSVATGSTYNAAYTLGTAVQFANEIDNWPTVFHDKDQNKTGIIWEEDVGGFSNTLLRWLTCDSIGVISLEDSTHQFFPTGTSPTFFGRKLDGFPTMLYSTDGAAADGYTTGGTVKFGIYQPEVRGTSNLRDDGANYLGLAQNAADSGDSVTIGLNGYIDNNQFGLNPGSTYYINKINGSLDLGTNNGSVVAGIATANGSIQIQTVDSA
jgi:hypothetical protein